MTECDKQFSCPRYSESIQRVVEALRAAGHSHSPVLLSESARTAQEAAQSLNVATGQIAKSVILRRKSDAVAVLVITAGDQRVDEKKVAALVGAIARADADFVREATGFVIGGVSPVAHRTPPVALFDETLRRFGVIWAAAGHAKAVFQLQPEDLPVLCPQGQWAEVV